MRELRGVDVDYVPNERDGRVDPQRIAAAFRDETKLVVVNHGSNVTGVVQDETAFELFYRVRVHGHLFVQPTLQYIRHPAAASGVARAVVGTLRVELRW